MSSLIRHYARRSALVFSLAAAASTLAIAPASAHSVYDAATSGVGCGWSPGSYTELESKPVEYNGSTFGRVHLLWNGSAGENCVVTRKLGDTHGRASWTYASLTVQGAPDARDGKYSYSHYATAVAESRGKCVYYYAQIDHPDSGNTATAGRFDWAYCGG